ncbi:Tat pathway signal protein [Phytoactinopolyspora halotolerans]|uniref:Tat pathway signal protein n=1 Tax=Phytoactinopolyspora halotolerans TaxID=1981512 RepID=A0A6L9SC97_9ACTN|nr:Tat pathway signal protein [Phytoactinopolyspora halotolerans]NEE02707.1 Tat pathway signal protein [Phytoactinopolyspora halotolerans]
MTRGDSRRPAWRSACTVAVTALLSLVLSVFVPVAGTAASGVVGAAAPTLGGVAGQDVGEPAEDHGLPDGYQDVIVFGDPDSETAHGLAAESTAVVEGGLGQPARVAQPLDPVDIKGGELRFTMRVDPVAQNYFTLKFWGGDESGYKTIAYINGEQIGYRRSGDYEASNIGSSNPLPGRFYYNTIMLPLEHTRGEELVEITVRTYHGGFSGDVTEDSRGYYRAYTHTTAHLDVSGEEQGGFDPPADPRPDHSEAEKQDLIDGYTASQVKLFNDYSAKVDAGDGGKLSIVRYQDELRFYAQCLFYDWCPAQSEAEKRTAVDRILKTIDNHVLDYYGNTRLLLRGGHQGDWGGYYGALGEALYIIENLLADEDIYGTDEFEAFLDQPFATGTEEGETSLPSEDWDGGELTRREAYERVLKANFDFARSRHSYIYNQVLYTYEGAWEAHEGLRVIGSEFYEGKERSHQILGEALGWEPYLGEEVLVGPEGEELDVYHSLFWHDQNARFTDDYVQIIGKGLAQSKLDDNGDVVRRLPYGEHYTGFTKAGLTRENTYVANYGETVNYLPEWVFRTLDHAGDEELGDQILKSALKNIHARGYARYTGVDGDGHRVMRMQQVVDERNASYPGWDGYAVRVAEGKALLWASLEKHMAENAERYSGEEWDEYWDYAREAVAFAQQQLADHQYFNHFGNVMSKNKVDYQLADTYAYITEGRAEYERFDGVAAGAVHPQTDFDYYTEQEIAELGVDPADYERFAWVDIDNMFVSLRDGDTRIFGSLFERNRGYAGNGRLHVMNPTHDTIVQIDTDARLQAQDYYARIDNIDVDFMEDQQTRDGNLPQALAGEIAPIAYQPGVGTVNRDGLEPDTPYSGYADFLTARYGHYFFAFNTTRDEYGNAQTFEVDVPSDHDGSTVLDLVSGEELPVGDGGTVSVAPETAVVLKLDGTADPEPTPGSVDFVTALPDAGETVVSWKAAGGASSYTIRRSQDADGPFEVIATGVEGTSYVDESVQNGRTYYYTVAGENESGSGWASYATGVEASEAVSQGLHRTDWRDDRVGDVDRGRASASEQGIRIAGANGSGLGDGNDHIIYERDIEDSFHFVHQVLTGSGSVRARIDQVRGDLNGVMLRDHLEAEKGRYIYLGADADGDLVLRNRSRDSFHDWQDEQRSPLTVELDGYHVDDYPHVKLDRDTDSHIVHAYVSADGSAWEHVGELFTPMPDAVHAGVVADTAASFGDAVVAPHADGELTPYVERERELVTVRWNKPDRAVRFDVYRSDDGDQWEQIADHVLTFSYDGESLRHGSRHYRVVAFGADGSELDSGEVTTAGEPIADVIAYAESVPAEDYTKGSHYRLSQVLEDVKAQLEEPGHDERALIDAIYDAVDALVSVDTLLQEVQLDPSMVEASTIVWPGEGTKQENGWKAFDDDTASYPDTLQPTSWIDVRLGAENAVALDAIRIYPRESHISRANGTVFQGSDDDGTTWDDLLTVGGVDEARWYQFDLEERTDVYERLRIWDDHDGRCNLAEVELLTRVHDTTLLTLLLDEAAAVDRTQYTEASLAALDEAVEHGDSVLADQQATEQQIDDAAERLLQALDGLTAT